MNFAQLLLGFRDIGNLKRRYDLRMLADEETIGEIHRAPILFATAADDEALAEVPAGTIKARKGVDTLTWMMVTRYVERNGCGLAKPGPVLRAV